ncbi:AAA family ATPase [Paramaledivibacter caminithermalis]|jgi:MoxR-like ATPase|uniref:MoxR-like ATPase n=1 Tax=Paramaledivibacter caminithermalis (strain DSM 15212 / CIP 107654 / DViRD3) TaxID=1121301 RepID=A0A1M6MVX3_PARC5|nr:MoxR family ATPase [Paramaledivibacter caminithermalis]SHJ87648.1 MoxR-like ATPase [Paramaledivibacter caminithermalis DSM 15212]
MEKRYIRNFQQSFEAIEEEIKKAIIGQEEIVRNMLIGIVAGGNVLMEGTPGLGKTQLVKVLSQVLNVSFARIQFTPDLMPIDILGTVIVNKKEEDFGFTFQKGPIFNSLILADEINRATPKTQSAMLEAMQEKTITVGGDTYKLPEPFFVLATENPLDMEGTYPLPEAQLDRFLFKLKISIPNMEALSRIIDITTGKQNILQIKKVADKEAILKMKEIAMKLPIALPIKEYAIRIMLATHPQQSQFQAVKDYVKCGVSPRGVQAMIKAAKVRALAEGRFNVSYDDIEDMAYPCLRHRIFMNFRGLADGVDTDDIIKDIVKRVK